MGTRIDTLIGTLREKMKGIGEGSMTMMNSTQAKLKAARADEMMNNLQEKLKQAGMMNNLQEKLKQPFLQLENFGLFLIGRFDEIFPPETRKQILHWLCVGAPFVVAGLVGLVLLWCFSRCIGYFLGCVGSCIGYLFRCVGRCIGYFFHCVGRCCGIKMMKAPGMNFRIPRFIFEAFPKACFRVLRALRAIVGRG